MPESRFNEILSRMRANGVRIPYYINKKTPWHHVFFSQFRWYHHVVGGSWEYVNPDGSRWTWMRFEIEARKAEQTNIFSDL